MSSRKGIVKSGNAGNSSKADKMLSQATNDPGLGEKPLFPPGSKFPLSLLHERCQKEGWEKPYVDTFRQNNGWSFRVTLSKIIKKTSQTESVRLEPHPPYLRPTSLEARHWGATYALYRFCNGIQLNRVLPPGPRDYWAELAVEHRNAPEHNKWMYQADPFAARKEVDERQARAAHKGRETSDSNTADLRSQPVSSEYYYAPEVKMASGLREMVENTIKKASSIYPEAEDIVPSVLGQEDVPKLLEQLGHLGFKQAQSRSAIKFLSEPSALTSNLLGSLSSLEASIEYLVLNVPECDLPERFLPNNNSSNPFITSTHSGTDDLKKRWIEDKAIKEAGWPAHVVKRCTSDRRLLESWDLLIAALGRTLIGEDVHSLFNFGISTKIDIDAEEVEALGAQYIGPLQLAMPLFSAPVKLHILVSPDGLYPHTGYPPMYITSPSIPAYIRLHLLSQLLRAVQADTFVEPGESFCMAAMRFLEDQWASIEDNGPPDMSEVLRHLILCPPVSTSPGVDPSVPIPRVLKARKRTEGQRGDNRNDKQIRDEFETLCGSDRYAEMFATRKRLPAFSAKNDFLKKLEESRVIVVVGETGCGKTTQLPQFILDSLILAGRGSRASIIVTQPRRLSAISVAARVSAERLDDGSVGYAIRGESKQSKKTKLLFCTTGIVLRRLSSGDSLQGVTHVIVDEVHERSVDGDFLLLELKELLMRHSSLKVILMSATINEETFVKYFDDAPLLTIPGFTHPVTDKYLEDIIPSIPYRPPTDRRRKEESVEDQQVSRDYVLKGLDDQAIQALRALSRSNRIDFQLVAAVVGHVIGTANKPGGILIFLPGVQEIRQCIEALRAMPYSRDSVILPLHANLSNEEQRLVFAASTGWKIIAATNVAETSITIGDVIYVVDTGKVKENQFDPENGLSKLVETWVTRAAARQRRGRAGRTQPGVCYKLYTRKQEDHMAEFPVPEILRVPLESISLAVKVMRESEDVKMFLSRAISPPKTVAMENAWSTLEELGAINQDGNLTALGRHMSTLPVDLRLAKMLVLGTIFKCLGPILTIAACLSSKPLFVSPIDKRDEASMARARFATGNSDLLTDLKAYDECVRLRSQGKPPSTIKTFCEEVCVSDVPRLCSQSFGPAKNFISPTAFREITSLRLDFHYSLCDLGFIPLSSRPDSPAINTHSDSTSLLKAIILGGLWPRVARAHLPKSAIKFDKVQAGTVQRENTAKEFKIYDLREGRVFLHPASVLFGATAWKSPFLAYFNKHMTSKIFLRDATEVPLYALLLFGGPVSVNHIAGGVTIRSKDNWVKLKAWPRIGILVNQLRRLLDAQLQRCIEEGTMLHVGENDLVQKAMLALLTADGLSE
ncbi:hypothetical protein PILCRDRAFT_813926 [Piloderma croceum F 1598]|uniref:RNA helicase n=1 Tax=Piloderma croceum (strain F 1598) TaxID=765440 RepID=A0A0C3CGN8_PILCF|nr:hypothetical protein PILCRDRAFT_813926 [Piloderma croceum F 1598]